MNRQDRELLSYKEEGKEKGMGAGTIESWYVPGTFQCVCCTSPSSGVGIIIIIPIVQMRKLTLAQRLGLEPECAKVLDAKAPPPQCPEIE